MGLFVVFSIAGCGGGGNSNGTSSTVPGNVSAALTVSGTASEGAPIVGKSVKLKDAIGKSAVDTITNATTGSYSIDVTGLTAPFLVTVTGANGTYVSLAQTAGTANINPITTSVVALAAGTSDVSALFTSLTPVQLTSINANYIAKSAMVSTSLQAVLPAGVKAEDYFIGAITAGKGMDAVFDSYQIAVHPTAGITVKTKDVDATTVLTIPATMVTANTTQPLPVIIVPTAPPPAPVQTPTPVAEPTPVVPVPAPPIPVQTPNFTPIANAGTSQSVFTNSIVTLNGSASSDANGDNITYNWTLTSKPNGSSAVLSNSTATKPTFTPDIAGTYNISLVVNDGKVNSATATVAVTASTANTAPVAIAGSDQSVNTGSIVFLNGAGSYDPDGNPLTFQWSFVSRPLGSAAVLSSPTTSAPFFVADSAGNYTLSLTVSDGSLSCSDTVAVTAIFNIISPPKTCCKVCTTGKACGDTCISKSSTCHISGGCAC